MCAQVRPASLPEFEPLEMRLCLSAAPPADGSWAAIFQPELFHPAAQPAARHVQLRQPGPARARGIGPDFAEPNQTRRTAYDLGTSNDAQQWPGLTINKVGDLDYFKFTLANLPADQGFVRITFNNSQGDLDMRLFDSRGRMLDFSDSSDNQEQISLAGFGSGVYYLEVYGYGRATSPGYTLTVSPDGQTSVSDRFEPNESLAAAADLGSVTGEGNHWDGLSIAPSGDLDFFSFNIAQAGAAGQSVTATPADGSAVELDLFDSGGNAVGQSSGAGAQTVGLAGLPAGKYYAQVSSPGAAVSFDYGLDIVAPAAAGDNRQWTVLTYVAADNDLEPAGIADVNEMEAANLPADVTVATLFDRIRSYDSSNGNWSDTRRGPITHDDNPAVVSSPLTSVGEQDMGQPQTLTDFIRWGVSSYPAQHYALVIWDHGDGLWGNCWDYTNSDDNLSVAGLAGAVTAAGTHFDVVGFDTCLAGVFENLYSLRNATDYVVASEQLVPTDGWDYTGLLNQLGQKPTMSGAELAAAAVNAYADYYGSSQTMSATRTSAYPALADALTNFADVTMPLANRQEWSRLTAARKSTAYYYDQDYRDLRGFMAKVASTSGVWAVRQAAQAVVDAVDASVVANHSGPRDRATGISINLPKPAGRYGADQLYDYTPDNFDLLANCDWLDFLRTFTTR